MAPISLVPEFLSSLPRSGFLFIYALLFALVEIEIEGKDGWAVNLPTWFRRRGAIAGLYGKLLSGKPLTGYHAVMFFIPFFSFHLGWAFGLPFSWSGELRLFTSYLVWNVTWDFLWFLLNPYFGWARFRKGGVWWHNQVWVARLPIDYVYAIGISTLLSCLPWFVSGDAAFLRGHLYLMLVLLAAILVVALFVPAYQRRYRHMRRPGSDERP